MEIMHYIGNMEILKQHKTAFLCSRKYPAAAVLKAYDWAAKMRKAENCVISGFHSPIEKDVLHFLLKGKQSVILVLARGMKDRFEPEIKQALAENRLLVISPFEKEIEWTTTKTAEVRNKLMIELADDIVVGFLAEGGGLAGLLSFDQFRYKIL